MPISPRRRPVAVAVWFWSAVNVAIAIWMAMRGLDRTDEGYYLNSISHPEDDRSTILLFGYAYHPLFRLVDGDIVKLRWTGMLATGLLVAAFAWTALGTPALTRNVAVTRRMRAAASIGIGTFSLVSLIQFPLTPSYNSLAEQGLAISATGLILGLTRSGHRAPFGWVALGVGGWLTFLAKPTSGAALAALIVAVLLLMRWRAWRQLTRELSISLVTCLVLAVTTLALARLTPADFVTVLSNGLQTSVALGGHDRTLRWDPAPRNPIFGLSILAVVCLTVLVGVLSVRLASRGRLVHRALALALVLATSGTLAAGSFAVWRSLGLIPAAGSIAPGMAFGLLVVSLCGGAFILLRRSARRGGTTQRLIGRPGEVIPVFLTLLPAAYAVGTNNNLWSIQGRAAVFPMVALTGLLAARPVALLAVPLSALTLLAPLQAATVVDPYRYESLLEADSVVTLSNGGTVRLTRDDAARTTRLQELAREIGLKPGTPLVDLTGESPGYIFELGGRPIGQGWILGGYPGSEAAAVLALEHDRCRLKGAWVLAGDMLPRGIPSTVLHQIGLDLARDFVPAGHFDRNPASFRRGETSPPVSIYAPRSANARSGCE